MARARSPWIKNRPLWIKGMGNWPRRCQNCPGNSVVTGNRPPPGLAPFRLAAAHRAGRWGEQKNAGIPEPWELRRCTGRL